MSHRPTDETRGKVSALSAYGIPHDEIAAYLGITKTTLEKHYRHELTTGLINANAKIAETLYKKAKDGDTTACIFWLKTRARWREVQKMELSGEVKNELEVSTTLADLMLENYHANRKKKVK